MITPTPFVTLAGKEYPISWARLAIFRFSSIPSAQANVQGPSLTAQFLWAMFRGVAHPFPSWEHVLAALAAELPENYNAIEAAVNAILPPPPAQPTQPKQDASEPVAPLTEAEKKSDSMTSAPSPASRSV